MPPLTTKRRITTNLKTKNNQNWQKIELYGSLKTKELKRKHSTRLEGRAETGSWDGEVSQRGGGWQSGQSHIHMQINQEEKLWSETDHATQGSSTVKKKATKPLAVKPVGVVVDSQHHRRAH